jgi:hypothetical protein
LYFGGGAAAQSTTSDGSDASNDGGWRVARATYYGAPESFAKRFDPKRGEGSFGILAYGSCGYTNSGGGLPYPRAEYAAAADANADYPGSCGRWCVFERWLGGWLFEWYSCASLVCKRAAKAAASKFQPLQHNQPNKATRFGASRGWS